MAFKQLTRESWIRRNLGSVGAKIILILLAMAVTSAVGSLMINTAFERITTNVDDMTQDRLPTLAQTADVGETVSKAQTELITLLLASDSATLATAHDREEATLNRILAQLPDLAPEQKAALEAELTVARGALETLTTNRTVEFSAAQDVSAQVQALSQATITAQSQLAQSAQEAEARMRKSSTKIVTFMDSALKNLVGREFSAINQIMQLRTDVAVLAVKALMIGTAADLQEKQKRIEAAREAHTAAKNSLNAALDNPAIRADLALTKQALSGWNRIINAPRTPHTSLLRRAEMQQLQADGELAGHSETMMMMLQFASEDVGASNLASTNDLFGNEVRNLLQILDINNRLALFRATALELVVANDQRSVVAIGERLPELYQDLLREITSANVTLDEATQLSLDALVGTDGLRGIKLNALNARNTARTASLTAAAAMGKITQMTTDLAHNSRDGIAQSAEAIARDVALARDRLNAILISSAIVVILGIWLTHLFILRPLGRLSETTEHLAAGDMSPVEGFDRSSTEIARIARALTVFRNGLVEKDQVERRAKEEREARQTQQKLAVNALGNGLERLTGGDLTARVTVELEGGYKKLRDDFNTAVERLEASVQTVSGSGRSIVNNSGGISGVTRDLSQKSGETADTLAETTSSLSRLSKSISGTAEASNAVSVSVQDAQNTAIASIEVVDETISAMRDLQVSSQKIAEIIGTIDGIAQQTNLLALNAGVEAARAGSVGKGFAVVASEVRELASKSKAAADQITQLVKESNAQVELGSDLVGRTGKAMSEISNTVAHAAKQMSEISNAAGTQSQDLQSINHAMIALDNTTKMNDQLLQGVTQSSAGLSKEARAMQAAIDRFQVSASPAETQQDAVFLQAM